MESHNQLAPNTMAPWAVHGHQKKPFESGLGGLEVGYKSQITIVFKIKLSLVLLAHILNKLAI